MTASAPGSSARVFVSFARAGSSLIRHLFERLEAQSLEVWNYDRPSHAIPLTQRVSAAVHEQLLSATHFIAFVSEAAFSNPTVCDEVGRALDLHRQRRLEIIVFVDKHAKSGLDAEWPGVFDSLRAFRYVSVDLADRNSVGNAVEELCATLGVEYVPSLAEVGRVRLIERVYQELRSATVRSSDRERDTFSRIVRMLEQAHAALEACDEVEATRLMQLAILFIEHEYPTLSLYYVKVLHAVQLARSGQLVDALTKLKALVELPGRDACVVSAIAYVEYQLENFAAALQAYEEARRELHGDVADAMSALLCRLRLGQPVNLERELQAVEQQPRLPGDEPMLKLAKALAYRLAEQPQISAQILSSLLPQAPRAIVPEVVEQLTYALRDLGREEGALQPLTASRELCPGDPRILRSLSIALQRNPVGRLKICRELARDHIDDLQSAYEALRGLWQSGARDEAQLVARRFLQHYTSTRNQFETYVAGAAYWIIADDRKANLEYDRSGMTPRYSEYLHR